jgi:hypothetical protein
VVEPPPAAPVRPPVAAVPVPPQLKAGQASEAGELARRNAAKDTVTFRPSEEQTETSLFKILVGKAKQTKGGQFKGTIFDSRPNGGLLELKFGNSVLKDNYQLRLQLYYSVSERLPYELSTTRVIEEEFREFLLRWGTKITTPP